jgi:hypothetical protein
MYVSTSNSCRYSIFLLQVSDIVYLAQVAMYKTQWSITSVILEILPKSIPISYIIQCTVNNILDVIIYSNLIRMAMFTFLLFYYIDYSFNTLTTLLIHWLRNVSILYIDNYRNPDCVSIYSSTLLSNISLSLSLSLSLYIYIYRALDVRLSEWCCSVSMVWVQIPSREEQKFDSSKI